MTSMGHGRDISTKQDLQSEHLYFFGGKANCSIKNNVDTFTRGAICVELFE